MLSYRACMGATVVVLAGLGLLAAGCGGTSDDPASAAGTPTGANGFAAYTDCLARNGVTLASSGNGVRPSGRPSGRPSVRPSGNPGRTGGGFGGGFGGVSNQPPAGVDAATWQKAQEACASVRPTAGPGGFGGANNSALVAYRNCLSEHGVTRTNESAQLTTADPATAAALTACEALRPTARPNPTPTPAT